MLERMDVCEKCGDKGDVKELVYCIRCKDSVEHRYCLDILPKRSEKQILWTCEDCVAKEKKLVGSRKSERICQAVGVKLSRKQQKKPINSTKKKSRFYLESIPESNASSGSCLLFNKDSNQQPVADAIDDKKDFRPKRSLLHYNDEENSHKELKPVETEASQLEFAVTNEPLIPEANTSRGDCLLFDVDSDQQPPADAIIEKNEFRRPKRRLLLDEDEEISYQELEPVETEASQLVSAVINEPLIPEANTSRGDCLLFGVDHNQQPPADAIIDKKELRRPKRRLLLEDEEISDEELEPVETEASLSTFIPNTLIPEADASKGDCLLLFNEDPIQQPAAEAIIDNEDAIKSQRRFLNGEISDQELESVETEATRLVSAVIHDKLVPEADASRGDCLLFNEDLIQQLAADANIASKDIIRAKSLLLEEGEISDQELEPVEAEVSQLVFAVTHEPLIKSSSLLFLESHRCVDFKPTNDPIWSGQFIINNVKFQTSFKLVSHLMKEDCSQARNTVNLLPQLLSIEMLSKFDVQNERFQISDGNIFLYFFPVYESDEKVSDSLLDDMMHRNLALKAITKQAQLLVFSSTELPLAHWRICKKYYMWGVLQPTNHAG